MCTGFFPEGEGCEDEVYGGEDGVQGERVEVTRHVVQPRQREQELPRSPERLHHTTQRPGTLANDKHRLHY